MVYERDDMGARGQRMMDRRRAVIVAMATMFGRGLTSVVEAAKTKKRDKGNKKQKTSGSARDVVKTAQKYKGAKYKAGGDSPKSFDCSGFTWYVYKKATGKDISHGVEAQWKQGRSVGRGDWKPGDLVFFKNTFERGLSHNGIYIGGDEFIHAENEKTGVAISTLKSGHYDDHYAGARGLL